MVNEMTREENLNIDAYSVREFSLWDWDKGDEVKVQIKY